MRVIPMLTLLALMTTLAGCPMLTGGGAGGANAAPAQPGLAAQGTILALQTWLMLEQSKAKEAGTSAATAQERQKQLARAATAGSIMTSLGSLRSESNCAKRLQLANAVSGGLQAEFPTYQAELSLGTNLAGILVSGFPGCQ